MYIINQFVQSHGVDENGRSHRHSKLFLPDTLTRFCDVLEDCERPFCIKVDGETALPRGVYRVVKTHSQRFDRETLHLYTHETDLSCRHGGIIFTGIRPHGGNTVEDTSGCPLLADMKSGPGRIYGAKHTELEEIIFPLLDDGEEVYWVIA